MSSETVPRIPEQIREMMTDEEIENMQSLSGWAVGHVTECNDRVVGRQFENAWIELFNGEGRGGEFSGVRFMHVDEDGTYEEAYAYPSKEAAERNNADTCFYVHVFTHPEDPDVGPEVPA